ncbi:MAG: anaerobic ribonucleoside-triphosphate reductase activating protein [bacterium]
MDHCPIKQFRGTTLIDYPGKVASIIFTGGCNFRCRYCHNRALLDSEALENLDTEKVLRSLANRRGFIEGVVITGGEPTIHHGIIELISRIKRLGLAVKLDTNGTHPEILEWLIEEKLIDYIAMDYKAPLHRYEIVTDAPGLEDRVRASASLIIKTAERYEFRTTIHPMLHTADDIDNIAIELKGATAYYLQQYYPFDSIDKTLLEAVPYPPEFFHAAIARNKHHFSVIAVRNLLEPSKTYLPPTTPESVYAADILPETLRVDYKAF